MLLKAMVHILVVVTCLAFAAMSVGEASDNDRGANSGFNIKALTIKKATLMPAGGGGYEIATALSGGGGMDIGALSQNSFIQAAGGLSGGSSNPSSRQP